MSYERCCICDRDDGLFDLAELDMGPGVLVHPRCFEIDKMDFRHQIHCCLCRMFDNRAELVRRDDHTGGRLRIRFAHKECVADQNERIRQEAVAVHQRLEVLKAAGVDICTVGNIWDDVK